MRCKAIHKKLIPYLDGELSPAEMKQVKMHLAECNECVVFAKELSNAQAIINTEKSQEINPFFYSRLNTKIEAEDAASAIPAIQTAWAKVLQPALFSILLIAGVYLGSIIGKPEPVNVTVAKYSNEQIIPHLNEMDTEPIEDFLMR